MYIVPPPPNEIYIPSIWNHRFLFTEYAKALTLANVDIIFVGVCRHIFIISAVFFNRGWNKGALGVGSDKGVVTERCMWRGGGVEEAGPGEP